jgi:hypothetical protein
MSNRRKLAALIFGMVIVLPISILAVAQIVQASPSSEAENILGSWSVDATATTVPAGFPALLTFTADGAVLADEAPMPGETTGHGNWVRGSHGEVRYTFWALNADPNGVYAGKFKVVGTLQRDPGKQTWSGPFKITGYNPNNSKAYADTGTFKLTRIAVESLD